MKLLSKTPCSKWRQNCYSSSIAILITCFPEKIQKLEIIRPSFVSHFLCLISHFKNAEQKTAQCKLYIKMFILLLFFSLLLNVTCVQLKFTELKCFDIVLCTSIHSAAPTVSTAFKGMSQIIEWFIWVGSIEWIKIGQGRAHCCLTLMSRFAYKWLPLALIHYRLLT